MTREEARISRESELEAMNNIIEECIKLGNKDVTYLNLALNLLEIYNSEF